ncbi:MAG: M23 family metallopeptidase [Alphaproteobacteria bacterium]|nr:M23 family metallopeptidase [Alphaproteobacteria bacterium]
MIQDNGISPTYTSYIGQPLKISLPLIADKHTLIQEKVIQDKVSQNLAKSNKILKAPDHKPVSNLSLPASALKPLKKPTVQIPLSEETVLSSRGDLEPQVIILPTRKPSLSKQKNENTSFSEIQKSKEAKLPFAQLNPHRQLNFLWPLKGKILSGFGAKSILKYNRGINISAALGDSVVACENGIVAYSGNEIKGFGNLILIKHANGWMSAYAHNRHLLVKRGDNVQRGQKIAEVGTSGNVEQPQLHFELRQKTHAVDPQKYLGY